jgi:cytochrome b561
VADQIPTTLLPLAPEYLRGHVDQTGNRSRCRSRHRDLPSINQENCMSDSTCSSPALDHLGSQTAGRPPDLTDASTTDVVPAYTMTARILHWVTAILILSMVPLGLVMANDWGGPLQDFLYDLHRSVGALVVPLIVLRLIYRRANSPLPLPTDIPAIQRLAAHATHWCLYALVLVQPIIGWVATSAYPVLVKVFGWFELPPIWSENRTFSEHMFLIHGVAAALIAALVVVHIGGALYHHLVRKDGVLMRMITG